jgi:tetratricopeptide (TPR) repeat protein
MNAELTKLKGIVAALAAIVMYSLPLAADEVPAAADLDDETALLLALKDADEVESKRVERQLQALWGKSGSPAMDLLLKRGRDALERDDSQQAIEHFTALTDHAPEFAEGWHARASAYFDVDLYGPAVADLERALALNPNNYNAIFGLGAILETFGESARAYEAYLRAQAIHPNHEDISNAIDRLRPDVEGKEL